MRHPLKSLLAVVAVISSVTFASQSAPAGEAVASGGNIRICFVTEVNPNSVVLQWYPLVSYLSEAVGRPFEIVLKNSFEEMTEGFSRGEIDLVMVGAFAYVKTTASREANLLAAAARGSDLHSVIIVRDDSPAGDIDDLKGRSFAFTDDYSTSGYLLPRILLAEKGIDQPADFFSDVVFTGHHSESINAVASGRIYAAAMASYLFDSSPLKSRVRVIAESAPIPPEPIFASPALNAQVTAKIRDALLTMHERVSPDVMKKLQIVRFDPITDKDYDSVRRYEAMAAKLPQMPYSVDYGRVPSELSTARARAWHKGWSWIAAAPAAASLLLLALLFARRRKLRRDLGMKLATSITGAMVLVSFGVSALFAADLARRLDNISLLWQRNINLFIAQAAKAVSGTGYSIIESLTDGLAAQEGVISVKVFRNGFYIADSSHQDVGHSIVPKILSDTFLPASDAGKELINTFGAITSGGRRFAIAQFQLDASAFGKAVRRAALANILAVLALLSGGILIARAWARAVASPVEHLSRAVAEMREGRRPDLRIPHGKDQIGDLVEGFQLMEAELRRTEEMFRSKSLELDEANHRIKQIEEREVELEEIEAESVALESAEEGTSRDSVELKSLIAEMETELPKLRELRSDRIIGDSPAFLRVIRDIIIRSRDSDPVLLFGESGSGKTGVAESIHALSARANRRFVEYNCAELAAADPAIVLGKLFGYGRDSGLPGVPKEGQKGLLDECDGATLFLDEIALLPLATQGTLLLPLEGRPFNPAAGKGQPHKPDVRFVFASNVRLEDEVRAGRFRNDLLRRIRSRGCIEIPPLRERMEDIDALAAHFLGLWSTEKGRPLQMSDRSKALLGRYDYRHFNIAELASSIKVAADNALFRSIDVIEPDCFEGPLREAFVRSARFKDEPQVFDQDELREISVLRRHQFSIAPSEAELGYSGEAKTLSNHLRGISLKVLSLAGWNSEEAAIVLVGGNAPAALNRIRRKIDFYLRNVAKLTAEGNERRLFNNLPQKHRQFMEEAIGRAKAGKM